MNNDHKEHRQICVDGTKLSKASITNEDYKTSIKKHDGKDVLFYIDPPYVGANKNKECLYKKGYCDVEPSEVASVVKGIKGKAIVSYDDHPEVRKAFKGFKMSKIELPYSFARNKQKEVKGKTKELLITNY
jgi:DNA adenine methylase